jgi:hypothetical protein
MPGYAIAQAQIATRTKPQVGGPVGEFGKSVAQQCRGPGQFQPLDNCKSFLNIQDIGVNAFFQPHFRWLAQTAQQPLRYGLIEDTVEGIIFRQGSKQADNDIVGIGAFIRRHQPVTAD